MLNDRFGLTMAVINGTKTQTRRIIPEKPLCDAMAYGWGDIELRNLALLLNAPYKVGEVIAVAQSYQDLGLFDCRDLAGYRNKMFVKAELMPYRIKITRVRLQLLQDISDEDCMKEGIYIRAALHSLHVNGYAYTFDNWSDRGIAKGSDTAKGAYASLIDKISGKGTWERNPYVLAYDFEIDK